MSDDGYLWNHGEAPQGTPSFTCPACGATSYHPMDVRYGYCGRCHDFTGEPTDFIFLDYFEPQTEEQAAFSERVRDMIRHRFESGYYDSQPIRVLTDEEREEMMARNAIEFRAHERLALTVPRPEEHARVPEPRQFDAFKARVLADPRVRFWYTLAQVRWHLWGRWKR